MKNLMLDIETMGTKNTSAIISIGAVPFDKDKVYYNDSFYRRINLQSCFDMGLTVDADTIIWWMEQEEKARKEFFNNAEDFHLSRGLSDFENYCRIRETTGTGNFIFWANGTHFDIAILENAYRACTIVLPWKYNNVRDFRTYKLTHPIPLIMPRDRSAHNALEDAIWQAEYCIEIMNGRTNKY